MPSYIVKDAPRGRKYHVFSTVVMDQTTADMMPAQMAHFLKAEHWGCSRTFKPGTFEIEYSGETTDEMIAEFLEKALVEGSDEWFYYTGGSYR